MTMWGAFLIGCILGGWVCFLAAGLIAMAKPSGGFPSDEPDHPWCGGRKP